MCGRASASECHGGAAGCRRRAAGVGAGFCDAGFFAPTAPSPRPPLPSVSQAGRQAVRPTLARTIEPTMSHMCANKENEVAFCEI